MSSLPSTPSMRLDGKRALVTGASRGIGLACAAALASAGAEVVLASRVLREVSKVAADIRDRGGKAKPVEMDVSDIKSTAHAIAELPTFDVLVNNAGMNRPTTFLQVSEADYDAIFATNVRGSFFVAQAVARRLVAAGRPGSIINISSQMGHVGAANRTVYCATKHAVEGMTKAMAADLGPSGIRVNSICPTFISTPMTDPFLEDGAFRRHVLSRIKLGRLGRVEDVMGAVVFLASEASALMTGSAVMIDGGWSSTS